MTLTRRLLNFAICLDQLGLSVITLGSSAPDEKISSAAYRLERDGRFWGKLWRPAIDWLFSGFESDHCHNAYLAEKQGRQLPQELRN